MTGLPPLRPNEALLHGCCLAVGGIGVLLLGAPGSGKSDLALRLIDQPGRGISGRIKETMLVADDQVVIRLVEDRLVASPPAILAGRLEVRGLGLAGLRHRSDAVLGLAVRLTARDTIERLPDMANSRFEILGHSLPMVLVDPAAASAPARIRAAVDWLVQRRESP